MTLTCAVWSRRRTVAVEALIAALILAVGAPAVAQDSAPLPASIAIDARKVENQVSPQLYGQFAEFMFQGVKYGLHAELLRNRSFEEPPNVIGLSRYWEREPDDRNDDPFMRFHWDDSLAYPPDATMAREEIGHSLRVTIGGDEQWRRGIRQGDIPIRANVRYQGYLWAKTDNYAGGITVALERNQTGGETYAASEIRDVQGDWKKYEFTLAAAKADPLAKLSILFTGKGRIWIDQVSLIPADAAPGQVRADVYELIKALRPAFIRWPGGNVAQDYHWRWGVGPRDKRETWSNLSWWNEPEPGDLGTDEFLTFTQALQTAPHLVVNVEGRGATAAEAAAWVEYVNGAAGSKYGAMRAANGHREPYKAQVWEVGNEIWGDWVRGHSDAESYARNYLQYQQAMRAADPSIKLIAVGDNDMKWNRTVLQAAAPKIEYLSIHHYYGAFEMAGDAMNLMARPLHYERFYGEMRQLLKEVAPRSRVKLIINEWNTSLPPQRQHSMESALYAARLMNVFERSGDLVEMSAVSDLVNGWIGGVIQAGRHGVFVTPVYWVNKMWNDHLGTQRLAAAVQGPAFDTTREGKNIPYLDVVATRSQDGKSLYIKAVNTHQQRDLTARVSLAGLQVAPQAQLTLLTAPELHTANSFTTPDAVTPKLSQLPAGSAFTLTLPKHSVAVVSLTVVP